MQAAGAAAAARAQPPSEPGMARSYAPHDRHEPLPGPHFATCAAGDDRNPPRPGPPAHSAGRAAGVSDRRGRRFRSGAGRRGFPRPIAICWCRPKAWPCAGSASGRTLAVNGRPGGRTRLWPTAICCGPAPIEFRISITTADERRPAAAGEFRAASDSRPGDKARGSDPLAASDASDYRPARNRRTRSADIPPRSLAASGAWSCG